ncbi:MAG: SMC-Scp complex subunit ScpB [Candidatus Eremiobacteraeota bacterium]|nr:SMC-Scp complex subunit ScpB [Candidatus Eremiobacteraeota bacterium]
MQTELVETGELRRKLEALLFVASEALSIKKLANLCDADEIDVTKAIAEIEAEYAERGIVVRKIAGGYRFATAPSTRDAVETYLLPPKTTLSPAALESLAIVAYNEHLEGMATTKAEIEAIRGVSADSVVQTLLDRGFIEETGRKEVPGRPILYKTTPQFLEAFGLLSLDELPKIDFGSQASELSLPIPTHDRNQ